MTDVREEKEQILTIIFSTKELTNFASLFVYFMCVDLFVVY